MNKSDKRLQQLRRKFAKINALHCDSTPESRKALRGMSDTWASRTPKHTTGFYKATKPGAVTVLD